MKSKSVFERSSAQLREHYEIEKALAERLRRSTREERQHLYREVYDELFRRVPHHSQLLKKRHADAPSLYWRELRLLDRFVLPGRVFLEVGAGDCKIALEIAKRARQVYAVDVSTEIVQGLVLPPNFDLILSDGCNIPVPPNSVDVVFYNQIIEHLHPDDTADHLREAFKALRRGGKLICITPHRYAGPHDISKHFDHTATGFHLKEYTFAELSELLRAAGFSRIHPVAGAKGHHVVLPLAPVLCLERSVAPLPHRMRRRVANQIGFRMLLHRLILLAEK